MKTIKKLEINLIKKINKLNNKKHLFKQENKENVKNIS